MAVTAAMAASIFEARTWCWFGDRRRNRNAADALDNHTATMYRMSSAYAAYFVNQYDSQHRIEIEGHLLDLHQLPRGDIVYGLA
jgi:hypothetical protein